MRRKFFSLTARQKAVLLAFCAAVSFAFMGVWIRMSGESFDTFQQSYLRILLAGLIAWVVFRRRLSRNLVASISVREWKIYGLRAIVSYIFGITAFTIAVQNADLAVVSLISAMPILGLLAWIMFREKVSPVSIPFILISALGVFFLTGVDLSGFHLGIGEIAAIVSAVGFNVGFLMSRLHAKQRSNYDNTTILLLIGWIPVCLLSVLATESIIPQHISLTAVIGLLFASAFNVFGLYAANYIFNNLKAYVAGNILLLEGVWAAVIGLVLYAESLTVHVVVGGLLILLSALTINRIDKKNEETLSV